MIQWLRAQSSIPSTFRAAHSHLLTPVPGCNDLCWSPRMPGTRADKISMHINFKEILRWIWESWSSKLSLTITILGHELPW